MNTQRIRDILTMYDNEEIDAEELADFLTDFVGEAMAEWERHIECQTSDYEIMKEQHSLTLGELI